jgi:hypothetical protein
VAGPPQLEEGRRGAVRFEAVVPGAQQVQGVFRIGVVGREAGQESAHAPRRDRKHVGLEGTGFFDRLDRVRVEGLVDADGAGGLGPFVGHAAFVMGPVGREIHLVGGGDEAARGVDDAGQ